jgi:hypothetical protein
MNVVMKEKHQQTLDELTKGNVWSVTESELAYMLIEGKKEEDYEDMETHYMNIIRTVFDIKYLDRKDEKEVSRLENLHYEIFSYPSEGDVDAIAIRKHPIKKITDLTLENIQHLDAVEVLELIKNNMGTGWKGLSLSIQDIIESAFFVDYSTLPENVMHRVGGIIDRRKEDGYDVLEIVRGNWIEAIFMKPKPKVEKVHIDYSIKDDDDKDTDLDDDDEDLPDIPDDTNDDEDEDDEIDMDNVTPEIEDIEDIEDATDDDDDVE